MRERRVFVAGALAPETDVLLDREAGEHLLRVLRLTPGAELALFNGDGAEYAARLDAVDGRTARVRVLARRWRERESPLAVTLVQAVVVATKMDLVIQKAVELGVSAIVPVLTERGAVRLDARRAARRQAHWEAIVRSACAQCGRNVLPAVAPPQSFAAWCGALEDPAAAGLRLALAPGGATGLRDLPASTRVTALIGPEGGLSDAELAAARDAGFTPLALGPRVLRTETAGLALLAALQSRWGDLAG